MSKHSGKIAVVTGGTGGLGRVVCERLLTSGAGVIALHSGVHDRTRDAAAMRERFPLYSEHAVDVRDSSAVAAFFGTEIAARGRIDIICNLAGGVGPKSSLEDLSLQQFRELFALNAESCFLMMSHALRFMKRAGTGRIINIAARPAVIPEPNRGGYDVAKAAVIALTRSAAEEVKNSGTITVNVIVPGTILTEANKEWGSAEEMRRWVTPEQIADEILVLCGDNAIQMNGQIIHMFEKDDHGIT
ncbi:MAG: SDR family oxidoreductase [Bacteroidetes bacterium]|nr:SDR family oxidoreductase [Bacteroidota bacterium]